MDTAWLEVGSAGTGGGVRKKVAKFIQAVVNGNLVSICTCEVCGKKV